VEVWKSNHPLSFSARICAWLCGANKSILDPEFRFRTEQAKRERGMPTLPSTIALEKATNPFLRLLEPDIVEAIRNHTGLALSTPSANFEALRNWKNTF
jgi:hypothetical protein